MFCRQHGNKRKSPVRCRGRYHASFKGNFMRSHLLFVAGAPLALVLSACGGETVVEDPSDPEQIAEAMGNLPEPQPGEYTMTGELVEFSIPGASEDEMAMMRGMFESGLTAGQTFCMTEEMAKEGYKEWLTQSQNVPEGCEFSDYKTSSDSFDATLACNNADGTSGTVKLTGTVSATSQDMRMEMDMTSPGEGPGAMRMVMETQTVRKGDCPA